MTGRNLSRMALGLCYPSAMSHARNLLVFLIMVGLSATLRADPAAPLTNAPTPAAATNAAPPPPAAPSLYDFTVNSLDGKPVDLAQYRGHIVLVVNTASKCGFTPQYAGLEKLYQDYQAKGFFILGFPSNDFGGQEPGTAQEIATFCSTKYNVTFPMFEKVKTKGEGQSPIYRFLTTGHGEPKWNFHKYLIDKNGQVIGEFPSHVTPDSKPLRDAIDAALKG
jgi:glutathione peroxidase